MRRPSRGIAVAVLLLLAIGAIAGLFRPRPPARAAAPRLVIASSLPLRWKEQGIGATLRADAAPAPAWAWLDRRYPLRAVDRVDAAALRDAGVLLLIQPRRLSPQELVRIDGWVRQGGRAILFADPVLAWPSDLPPGDARRPLYTSLLSPLVAHWGIDLTLPMDRAERERVVAVGDARLTTDVAGAWVRREGARGCAIESDGLIARCRVGQGRVLLVADADLLDARLWSRRGWMPWGPRDSAMAWLGREIDALAGPVG